MEDYFPIVKTVSAVVQADGTVLVTGRIENEGEAEIEYVGFCMNNEGNPQMLDNQAVVALNGSQFTAIYGGLVEGETYYFRAWATNDFGWKLGNEIETSDITVVAIDPPCSYSNQVEFGLIGIGGPQTFYAISSINANFTITANAPNADVSVRFSQMPTTGLYYTVSSSPDESDEVQVLVTSFNVYSFVAGSTVYVNRSPDNIIEVTICEGEVDVGISNVDGYLNLVSEP